MVIFANHSMSSSEETTKVRGKRRNSADIYPDIKISSDMVYVEAIGLVSGHPVIAATLYPVVAVPIFSVIHLCVIMFCHVSASGERRGERHVFGALIWLAFQEVINTMHCDAIRISIYCRIWTQSVSQISTAKCRKQVSAGGRDVVR